MGIIQRQATWNALNSYVGVVLGLVNKLIFFNFWLTKAQFGLVELLITFMVLGAELSNLGVTKIVIRFFPFFQDHKERSGKFIFFVAVYSVFGFLLVTLILLLGRNFIIGQYAENSPLFAAEFNYVIFLILAYKLYRVFSSLSQSLLNSVLPSFVWNILMRLVHLVLILLLHYEFLDFRGFLNGLAIGYFIPGLVLFIYVAFIKSLNWYTSWKWLKTRTIRMMLNYGWYSSLGEMTAVLVNQVDMLMIAWLIGEEMVATYAVAFYIAKLVQMPSNSIQAIAAPLVANDMKKRKLDEVYKVYQKSAITNFLIGGLVFIGLVINIDLLYTMFPKHIAGRDAMIYLALGILFNSVTGIHKVIINNSRYFKFNLYANFLLFILICVTNYLLIPTMGVVGASIATATSLLAYNIASCFYVYLKFRMHPFSREMLYTFILGVVVLAAGYYFPQTGITLVDMMTRSVFAAGVYGGITIWLDLSPDITRMVLNPLKKLYIRYFKS
ncbi:MAG: oligosaccharide flippase family protein [Bacteroidia bacterium]